MAWLWWHTRHSSGHHSIQDSSRCWAWQCTPISLNFIKGEKSSSQGAFWLLGVIFRHCWAVHRKAGVLSNIPNLGKVAKSWEKQERGLCAGPSPQHHVTCPCPPQPPASVLEGQGAATQARWRCGEPAALFWQPSLPEELLPIPSGGRAVDLVEVSCGLGLAHGSWCWGRIRQMMSNMFQGQVLCQDDIKQIKHLTVFYFLYKSSVRYSKIKSSGIVFHRNGSCSLWEVSGTSLPLAHAKTGWIKSR